MRVGGKRTEIRTTEGSIVLQLWIDQLKTHGDSKVSEFVTKHSYFTQNLDLFISHYIFLSPRFDFDQSVVSADWSFMCGTCRAIYIIRDVSGINITHFVIIRLLVSMRIYISMGTTEEIELKYRQRTSYFGCFIQFCVLHAFYALLYL